MGIFIAVSRDGGTAWTPRIIADGSDGLPIACCQPACVFDDFGNLWLAYVNQNASQIAVLLSSDKGNTFSAAGVLGSGSVGRPALGVGNGMVWAAFRDFTAGGIAAAGAAVTGLGAFQAFGGAAILLGSSTGVFPTVAIGPSGQVMVAYHDNPSNEGPATIFMNVDADGLGAAAFGQASAVTATNVGGADFIPAQPFRALNAAPGLAYDRSNGVRRGRVYLVYTDELPNGSDDTDVLLRFSQDDGKTWSSPIRVNDDGGTKSQFWPRVAVDPLTGVAAMSWYDCRNDKGDRTAGDTNGVANDEAQFFATVSLSGGTSVSVNGQVTSGSSRAAAASNSLDYGENSGLDFLNDRIFPAWADNSPALGGNPQAGTFEIATARVTLIPILSVSPTTLTSGGTAQGTVFLRRPAPTSGSSVSLSTSNPSLASVPSNVTISSGDFTTNFSVTSTSLVRSPTTVSVTSTFPEGETQTASLSLVENTGLDSVSGGGGGGGGCFVATAAYGSPLHAKVVALSRFRDEHLRAAQPGAAFTRTYEAHSPLPARFLARTELGKTFCRPWITPIVNAVGPGGMSKLAD